MFLNVSGWDGSYASLLSKWLIPVLLESCTTLVPFLTTLQYFDTSSCEFFSTRNFSIFSFSRVLRNHQHPTYLDTKVDIFFQARSFGDDLHFSVESISLRGSLILDPQSNHIRPDCVVMIFDIWYFYFRPDRVLMTFTLVLKDLHAVYIWRRKSLKWEKSLTIVFFQ